MGTAISSRLLDEYPLLRARCVREANERIGRVFSPHKLEVLDPGRELDVYHNQLRMRDLTLNSLTYGCDVAIDAGERADFYMVQLPLSGTATVNHDSNVVHVDTDVLSVLQPRARNHMVWSADCSMLMLQVPRNVVDQRLVEWGYSGQTRIALSRSRTDPEVAAWWQAALDLAHNLDRHGQTWMKHPAAYAAMEEFLLSAFTSMLCEAQAEPTSDRGDERYLRKAKEYIQAHLDRALTLPEIARYACVSPRTLEAAFKRQGETSPLAYARRQRLQAVHDNLRNAQRQGQAANVTEVAMSYGFVHMSRFAAQYREQFGCTPSETLRPH